MKNLKGALLLGQSGGPTSVINASAAGVFLEALKQENVTDILAAAHGIKGILNEDFIDIRKEDIKELENLKYTPSSAIGSVRYKLKDENDFNKLLVIFKKYNIRFFLYNGGNDSMDTCNKISKFLKKSNYDCNVIGVPKTIDNDLAVIDHCPGYGSAAKYIATSMMEIGLDATVYDSKMITVCEIMGRHAGWLTAASQISKEKGYGPDLIYLPEIAFDLDSFYKNVKEILDTKGKVIIAVSEGIQTKEGLFIPELVNSSLSKDAFGHAQLGGTASVLASLLANKYGVKTRAVEFSLLQRCASHLASQTDIDEAFNTGKRCVKAATAGVSDKLIGIVRTSNNPYKIVYKKIDLKDVANEEKKIPLEWILEDGKGLTNEYLEYVTPLIQGETKQVKQNGLPVFAKLKKNKF
ncbi:MAG: 6-phosphofructokinase [Acholeplasmatales bacterium]|jgi:6-phosphofructokinase 1|nr:6-phosphofructokinase [Acholeplasmatales bacterium]